MGESEDSWDWAALPRKVQSFHQELQLLSRVILFPTCRLPVCSPQVLPWGGSLHAPWAKSAQSITGGPRRLGTLQPSGSVSGSLCELLLLCQVKDTTWCSRAATMQGPGGTSALCRPQQVTSPIRASLSSSVKWVDVKFKGDHT